MTMEKRGGTVLIPFGRMGGSEASGMVSFFDKKAKMTSFT